MKKLYGVTTAMVTPMDANGSLDLTLAAQLTEFLIEKGVHCLYPLGTTGEMLRLSTAERKQFAETVVSTAAGRVNVFIHVGAMTQADTIELAKHAHQIGADGIGVVTPAYFVANDREIEQFFLRVCQSVPDDFPVYLYNIPQNTGNDLKADVVQRVAKQCRNVIGVKYSYPDYLRLNEYLAVHIEHEGGISVLPGTDRLFLPALAMGCDGVISGVSCVFPELFVAVYDAYQAGSLERARSLQRLAIQYCETLQNGSNMAYFKAALRLRGIETGQVKEPQLELTADEHALMAARLNALGAEAKRLIPEAGLQVQ